MRLCFVSISETNAITCPITPRYILWGIVIALPTYAGPFRRCVTRIPCAELCNVPGLLSNSNSLAKNQVSFSPLLLNSWIRCKIFHEPEQCKTDPFLPISQRTDNNDLYRMEVVSFCTAPIELRVSDCTVEKMCSMCLTSAYTFIDQFVNSTSKQVRKSEAENKISEVALNYWKLTRNLFINH